MTNIYTQTDAENLMHDLSPQPSPVYNPTVLFSDKNQLDVSDIKNFTEYVETLHDRIEILENTE